MKTKISKLVASAAAALALSAFSNAASASPEAWARADAEYEIQHYSQALAIYQQLAAGGDARAAERAGMMLAQGEKLYGDDVRRDTTEAARLFRQAAQSGSPTAQYLLGRADSAPLVRTTAR
jgi:TPR repeat protein